MSASFARPSVWQQFTASRDALDLACDIREGAAEIKRAGEMLSAYPADAEERMKARNAARQVIADCDALERLT